MSDQKETQEDDLFNLLVNISVSSETTLDRLSTHLRIFVKKYFDNQDFSKPSNIFEIVSNSILKSETILYTIYALEEKATTEEEKIELLYFKDLVLKTMVILTNLDFFVSELKENGLYKDAYLLREKLKTEFRIEASKYLPKNTDIDSIKLPDKPTIFKDSKPSEFNTKEQYTSKKDKSDEIKENLYDPYKNINLLDDTEDKMAPINSLKKRLEEAKQNREKKEFEPKLDKHGRKITRTASGWEIPLELLEKGLYDF